jgi:hypothetical protein
MRFSICAFTLVFAMTSFAAGQESGNKAETAPVFADFSTCANMGFADDKAGDGKGGWSDQGASNDFREFDIKAAEFGGVPFKIIDPAVNADGKAVLSFRHEQGLPTGLTTVTSTFPDKASGRYLYLLHTACYGPNPGDTVGTVSLTCRDGSVRTLDIQGRRDIADWWDPARLSNGVVVVSKPNQSAMVGIYLSRFDLGSKLDIQSLTLTTTGKAMWIVVAATITSRDIPLPELKALTIKAGPDWKPLPDADLAVKKGTALDCSAWVDHAPAGSRGRVIARPDGTLAFANDPDRPVRFFVVSGFPTKNPEDVDALADTIVRQGYNMVRLHFLDQFVAGQHAYWGKTLSLKDQVDFDRRMEAGEPFFNAKNLDLADRFVAALKKRGVYLYLDAMSSWTGCYPANCWYPNNGVEGMKARLYYDPVARRHWHNAVKAMFTRINPYTGTSFATDPQVVAVLGINEPTMELHSKSTVEHLLPLWRTFLAGRFNDFETFSKSWNFQDQSISSLDNVPFFAPNDIWHSARRRTVGEFLNKLEEETAAWMKNDLRSLGYEGIFTQYDWLYSLRLYLPRSQADMVSMHGYFAHPTDGVAPKSKTSPNSALADALNWWRGIASSRISGEPLAIMEYGQVYWNRFRYEEGLSVGAYGSFQDMSMLTAHSWPVALKPAKAGPFNVGVDPVARASQVVTGLLFMGREVAVAPHRIDIPLSRDLALDNPDMAISGDQTRLGLLTGLAVAVEGRKSSVPATMQMPLGDGTKTIDKAFYSTVVDSQSGTFADAVSKLRTKGILTQNNQTDAKQKIYESETGEILLDASSKRLTVRSPKLAGICADKFEGPQKAGKMTVEKSTVSASITIASRDGKALEQSSRLLLVIATDARNSGESYEDADGVVMRKFGSPPVLLRTGRFTVYIERDRKAPALRAWALAMNGTRRDELPVTAVPGGIRLDVDTSALSCGATPFFELSDIAKLNIPEQEKAADVKPVVSVPSAIISAKSGYARFSINGSKSKINFTPGTASAGGSVQNIHWGSPAEQKQALIVEVPLTSGWNEFSFSFTPDKDGQVQLDLIGQDKNGSDNKKMAIYTFYDDITATGAELENGGFESLDGDNPAGWWFWNPDANHPAQIVCDTNAHGGKYFAAAWIQGAVVQNINVKADKVTIRGFAMPAGEWTGVKPANTP